jgi:hypothetical protein
MAQRGQTAPPQLAQSAPAAPSNYANSPYFKPAVDAQPELTKHYLFEPGPIEVPSGAVVDNDTPYAHRPRHFNTAYTHSYEELPFRVLSESSTDLQLKEATFANWQAWYMQRPLFCAPPGDGTTPESQKALRRSMLEADLVKTFAAPAGCGPGLEEDKIVDPFGEIGMRFVGPNDGSGRLAGEDVVLTQSDGLVLSPLTGREPLVQTGGGKIVGQIDGRVYEQVLPDAVPVRVPNPDDEMQVYTQEFGNWMDLVNRKLSIEQSGKQPGEQPQEQSGQQAESHPAGLTIDTTGITDEQPLTTADVDRLFADIGEEEDEQFRTACARLDQGHEGLFDFDGAAM